MLKGSERRVAIAAKGLEALGIACVMIGLVEGLMSESMWMELYLGLFGVVLFLTGRRIEKALAAKREKGSTS